MRTSFVNSADGTRLRLAHWGETGREVLLVHGLAEHAGRYEHVGAAFAAAGMRLTLVELRGHGHSGGKRGHVDRWSDYIADVQAAASTLQPGWALLAHSMGGLVALDGLREALTPSRTGLSNALVGVRVKLPAWKAFAGKVLSRILPALPMKNEIDPAQLSRDLEVGKTYLADPLVFDTATPRWYTEMLAALERVNNHPTYPLPLAFFVGDDDQITDPVRNQELAKKHNAQLVVYPGFRHELVNEIGREQVIADMVRFFSE